MRTLLLTVVCGFSVMAEVNIVIQLKSARLQWNDSYRKLCIWIALHFPLKNGSMKLLISLKNGINSHPSSHLQNHDRVSPSAEFIM